MSDLLKKTLGIVLAQPKARRAENGGSILGRWAVNWGEATSPLGKLSQWGLRRSLGRPELLEHFIARETSINIGILWKSPPQTNIFGNQ